MKPESPNNGPVLRDHVYDGIQEYDQKLPNWWLFTWYITIVWFVIAWVAYYQLRLGDSDIAKVENAIANVKNVQMKEMEKISDDKLWEMSKDEKVVAAGAATFAATCVACHAPDLSAKIAGAKLPGLPLNDTEWKHGGNPLQMLNIVRKGAPDLTKGMPPWEPQLGLNRVVEVVAFVLSKHQKGEPVTLAADSPLKAGAATAAPATAAPAAPAPAPAVPAPAPASAQN
ncbi:MAG: c-type cytochrome [Prosthecobacter sp.]|jgi:cytochrome c oxidase cbb3-type subunit 3|uniref:cbb3-type cytochrome c oxidase N-terminal domain-containing protein n=1 Tax=Prosthecobacter sp. TaxID=1965333 RepID=UPI001A0F8C65|nr:cbb3-type cytochrome c oxidase N-terminal domain-containing protein [Prosthecobacter sp.]MBE2283967.1 c-type cytochrome [Prosthecobacter sp.]